MTKGLHGHDRKDEPIYPDDTPRTEAGRRAVRKGVLAEVVLAIEAEAAAGPRDEGLDVETLRKAILNVEHAEPGQGWLQEVAAEYATLKASE